MNNKQQFVITVDFGDYAYRYLFITYIIPYPDWKEDDKRWMTYDESEEVISRFKVWADKHIGGLNGKVIFVEPCNYVVADGTKES